MKGRTYTVHGPDAEEYRRMSDELDALSDRLNRLNDLAAKMDVAALVSLAAVSIVLGAAVLRGATSPLAVVLCPAVVFVLCVCKLFILHRRDRVAARMLELSHRKYGLNVWFRSLYESRVDNTRGSG